MEVLLRLQGRALTHADIVFIRKLIADHPEASRNRLSELVCAAWGWQQRNGAPCAQKCRSLMLALHRAGHIQLPPVRCQPNNPMVNRRGPPAVYVDRTPLNVSLASLGPLRFCQVHGTPEEGLFNWLIASEHYLGYVHPVGERLKFLVFSGTRPVALFGWSSPPRHLDPRDKYIAWSSSARRQNAHLIAYNTRFLVPSWVQVPNLASHLLSRMTGVLSAEWKKAYRHPVYFAETFVDTARHRGTCYRAANWIFLGCTTGRGKNDKTNKPNRTVKAVFGFPLHQEFREKLRKIR